MDLEQMLALLETRGINDSRVIKAMRAVDRRLFVSAGLKTQAYADNPLPIGQGQTISQPYIVALMTQALGLTSSDKVLEIGTGSGYQTAILSRLCEQVYSIEIRADLSAHAEECLRLQGCSNVKLVVGNGYEGLKEFALFDAIILTAAPTRVPECLFQQLAEGGRLCAPIGASPGVQELILYRRVGENFEQENLGRVQFVPMVKTAD